MEMVRDILNALAVSFDLPILDWIQANLQSPLMDKIMPIITMFGDAGIFWMVCAFILFLIPKTRRTGLGMAFAMMMGLLICNVLLKPMVGRIRPYDYQIDVLGKTMDELLVAGKLLVDTPLLSVPAGKVFSGWMKETVSANGSKTMSLVFVPDENGVVTIPSGTTLEPMVLYPLFENA